MLSLLRVRSCNATSPNQEIQDNREAGAIDNRSGDSRVEPGPFIARVPGRKGHKEVVSRLGLEPRALALKARRSPRKINYLAFSPLQLLSSFIKLLQVFVLYRTTVLPGTNFISSQRDQRFRKPFPGPHSSLLRLIPQYSGPLHQGVTRKGQIGWSSVE